MTTIDAYLLAALAFVLGWTWGRVTAPKPHQDIAVNTFPNMVRATFVQPASDVRTNANRARESESEDERALRVALEKKRSRRHDDR